MNSNYRKTRVDKSNAFELTVDTNTFSRVDIGQFMHEYNLAQYLDHKYNVAQYLDNEICNKLRDDILKMLLEQTEPVTAIHAIIACMTLVGILVLNIPDRESRKCCAKVVKKMADELALAAETLPLATEINFEASNK